MSLGKNCTRKRVSINGTITSIFKAISNPNPTPSSEPNRPIAKPCTKNMRCTNPALAPIVRKIAMSACLSVTVMTKVETKLNAATAIIKVKMMNIIFFSVWTAANQLRFERDQSLTQSACGTTCAKRTAISGAFCMSSTLTRKPVGSVIRNKAAASFQCMTAKVLSYS